MTSQLQSSTPSSQRVSHALYFLTLYVTTVGVLYLWGYWSTFNINIFEYLSLSDVIKQSFIPMATTFAATAFALVMVRVLPSQQEISKTDVPDTPTMRFLKLAGILSLPLAILFALYTHDANIWIYLAYLAALLLAYLLEKSWILKAVAPVKDVHPLVFIYLLQLLFLGYALGHTNANRIIDGTDYEYLISPVTGIDVPHNSTPQQRLRLLGYAGNLMFLFNPTTKVIVITEIKSEEPLLLKRNG